MKNERRQFLKKTALLGMAPLAPSFFNKQKQKTAMMVMDLPFYFKVILLLTVTAAGIMIGTI